MQPIHYRPRQHSGKYTHITSSQDTSYQSNVTELLRLITDMLKHIICSALHLRVLSRARIRPKPTPLGTTANPAKTGPEAIAGTLTPAVPHIERAFNAPGHARSKLHRSVTTSEGFLGHPTVTRSDLFSPRSDPLHDATVLGLTYCTSLE